MAKKQDNRRQVEPKRGVQYSAPGYSYNTLKGEDRSWAKSNRFCVGEHCIPVKDGKRFRGSVDTKMKCGDGSQGFSTRRRNHDEVKMEIGLDGQYKKKRGTLVRPKSARCTAGRKARRVDGSVCCLVSSAQISRAMRDPKLVRAEKALARCLGQSGRWLNRRDRKERGAKLLELRAEVKRWK